MITDIQEYLVSNVLITDTPEYLVMITDLPRCIFES